MRNCPAKEVAAVFFSNCHQRMSASLLNDCLFDNFFLKVRVWLSHEKNCQGECCQVKSQSEKTITEQSPDDFTNGRVGRSLAMAVNVLQLPEGRDFYHKTWFEKLMFD